MLLGQRGLRNSLLVVAVSAALAAALASCAAQGTTPLTSREKAVRSTDTGVKHKDCSDACAGTIDGAAYEIELPASWNGTLLLYSHGYRYAQPGPPSFDAVDTKAQVTSTDDAGDGSDALSQKLLSQGYALAGSSYKSNGWAVADGVKAAEDLHAKFLQLVGTPNRTYVWGDSLGGLITELVSERHPDWVDGAAPMCGAVAGPDENFDLALDVAYAVKQLIDPSLKLVGYASAQEAADNWKHAAAALEKAAGDVSGGGTAKVLLIAALADAPTQTRTYDGHDLTSQVSARVESMLTALAFGTSGRQEIEQRVGGDPSQNTGVDYSTRVSASEKALIETAGGNVSKLLAKLAAGQRISADPAARQKFEALGDTTGALSVPTLTMHTEADPLVIVQNETVFAQRVRAKTDTSLLSQLYIKAPATYPQSTGAPYGAGHCIFSDDQRVAMLTALDHWVRQGVYPVANGLGGAFGPGLDRPMSRSRGRPRPPDPLLAAPPGGRVGRPAHRGPHPSPVDRWRLRPGPGPGLHAAPAPRPGRHRLSSAAPRAVPLDALVALAEHPLGGAVVFRLAVLLPLVGVAVGMARLLRGHALAAQVTAVSLALWNPYVVERLAMGHWALLAAYAALPWLVAARVESRPRLGVAAAAVASITPTGGLVALATALALAGAGPRAGRRRRLLRQWPVAALQLPWVLPALLGRAARTSDPAAVAVFASRGEGPGGALAALIGGGGIWNRDVVPSSRAGLLPVVVAGLVLLAVAAAWPGLGRLLGPARTALVGLAAGGLLVALLSDLPWGAALVRHLVDTVPGAGLLRDAQKWVMPLVLLSALVAGLAVERAHQALRSRTAGTPWLWLPALAGAMLPVLLLPDAAATVRPTLEPVGYPRDWAVVRRLTAVAGSSGVVVVLPFQPYRQFTWAPGRPVLDPAPRYLSAPTVVDDRLAVGGRTLAGEDPLAADVADALAQTPPGDGAALAGRLSSLGARWLVVEHGTPGPVPDLAGLTAAYDGPDLSAYRLPAGPRPPRPAAVRIAATLAVDLALLVGLLGVALAAAGRRLVRPRRRPPRPTTSTRGDLPGPT